MSSAVELEPDAGSAAPPARDAAPHTTEGSQPAGAAVATHERVEEARPEPAGSEQLRSLAQAVARLEDAVQTRLSEADRSNAFIDRLEAEVKRLKQREDERRLEPAVKGIISLFDQVGVMVSDVMSRDQEMSRAERELARTIAALQKQVLELLNRLGATERVPAPASKLDGQWQEVVSTLETPDPEKHLTVAGVRRPGFEFAGRLCRPAAVQVFTHATETQRHTKEK